MWSDVLEPRVTAVEGRVIIDTSFLRELKQIRLKQMKLKKMKLKQMKLKHMKLKHKNLKLH